MRMKLLKKKKSSYFFIVIPLILLMAILFYRFFMGTEVKNLVIQDSNFSIPWYQDEDGEFYFFLPEGMNREELSFSFNTLFSKCHVSIYEDNKQKNISSVDSISLKDDDYYFISSLKFARTRKYLVHFMQSSLPSVFLNIDGGDDSYQKILSDNMSHQVHYPGDILLMDLNHSVYSAHVKKIRGRGNSTWFREKKPYQISFQESVSLLGMKESKKWIFLSNHWDGSLSRNYLWFSLAKKLGIDYSVDCSPCDLYINHQYVGSYLLTNKIEVSSDSISIDEGYFFEIMNQRIHDLDLDHGYQINIKYPNIKNMSSSQSLKVKRESLDYLNKIESLIYDDSVTIEELEQYIDIDSFIKFYWVQELSENYDASRGSNYFYVRDNQLFMGPIWDMDNTLNRSYRYTDVSIQYLLKDRALSVRSKENWFQELSKREEFVLLVDEFYKNHYDDFNELLSLLDDYYNYIELSASMNYIRWPYQKMRKEQLRDWITEDVDFHSSCQLLSDNLSKRIKFYQEYYQMS